MELKVIKYTDRQDEHAYYKVELQGQLHKVFLTKEDAEKYLERIKKIILVDQVKVK